MRRIALLTFLLLALTLPGRGVFAENTEATLTVTGMVPHPLSLSAAAFAALPHRSVPVTEENGTHATYSGVDLAIVLQQAGVTFGASLRGARLADYVVVSASDGYHVVFALPEMDAALRDETVIVADSRDGAPLDAKSGPFQIIVPDEHHHVRWIHNITSIAIERATPP
jgi:hypothetical protein